MRSLEYCQVGVEGAKALASALEVNAVLTKLRLDVFELPIKQLKGTEPVASLDLSGKCLGACSAIVIAKCLEFNKVLTSLK